VRQWGSYEEWSDLVRRALVWAGEPDPCSSRSELTDSNTDLLLLKQLIAGLEEMGGGPMSVRDMLAKLDRDHLVGPTMRAALAELDGDKPSSKTVGNKLRKFRGRIADGKRLESVPDRNGVGIWRVTAAGSAGCAGSLSNPHAREWQGEEDKRSGGSRSDAPQTPHTPHSSTGDAPEGR
jgi:hypothetical protein